MRRKWIFMAPVGIVGVILFVAVGGWIVQSLWNWLMPSIAGWRAITYWQALGLLLLCRILFGGFGGHGYGGSRLRRRWEHRWEHLTPEERERFRKGMRERWGVFEPSSGTKGQ